MQESFIFYRSYSDAIKQLPEKDQLNALWAIINHSVDEEEQQAEGLANIVYTMAKPQIEANIKRKTDGSKGAEYGALGGRPKKENPIGVISKTPNVNVNSNVNVNNNDNGNVNVNNSQASLEIITPKQKIIFTEKQTDELRKSYPDVDIVGEIAKIQESINKMPKCNLYGESLSEYIKRWLARTRDSGKPGVKINYGTVDPNIFYEKALKKSMKITE